MSGPLADTPRGRVDAGTFTARAMEQPCGWFELMDGEIIAMSPERLGHGRAKGNAYLAERTATAAAGPNAKRSSTASASGLTRERSTSRTFW